VGWKHGLDNTTMADFWAGYISGAAGIIIGNPLDLIKVRLQAGPAVIGQNGQSSGLTFAEQFNGPGALLRGN
jgi:solute carrier family 25 (mitochondrial carnitine/acylcarnitine transporter), member 20/29